MEDGTKKAYFHRIISHAATARERGSCNHCLPVHQLPLIRIWPSSSLFFPRIFPYKPASFCPDRLRAGTADTQWLQINAFGRDNLSSCWKGRLCSPKMGGRKWEDRKWMSPSQMSCFDLGSLCPLPRAAFGLCQVQGVGGVSWYSPLGRMGLLVWGWKVKLVWSLLAKPWGLIRVMPLKPRLPDSRLTYPSSDSVVFIFQSCGMRLLLGVMSLVLSRSISLGLWKGLDLPFVWNGIGQG